MVHSIKRYNNVTSLAIQIAFSFDIGSVKGKESMLDIPQIVHSPYRTIPVEIPVYYNMVMSYLCAFNSNNHYSIITHLFITALLCSSNGC